MILSGAMKINGQVEETLEFGETIAKGDPVLVPCYGPVRQGNVSTQPSGSATAIGISADGVWVSVGDAAHATYLPKVYKRTGDTLDTISVAGMTFPTGQTNDIAFSSDGTYVAYVYNSSPYVRLNKRTGDAFAHMASVPSVTPSGALSCAAFSSDDVYFAVAGTSLLHIYKRSGDVFTKLTDPATLPAGSTRSIEFSVDTNYLIVAHITDPYFSMYERSGDTFTKLANPTTKPTGIGNGAALSPDGVYAYVAHDTSPFMSFYKRSGSTLTKLANPSSLPTTHGKWVATSPDGSTVVVNSTNELFMNFQRVGDSFYRLIDPLSTLAGIRGKFASGRKYLAQATDNAPYIILWKSKEFFAFKNDASAWSAAIKSGYAKEAGTAGQSKKVIITHK
jgi:hypothetical protein